MKYIVCTFAKVGTTSIVHGLKKKYRNNVYVTHNLYELEKHLQGTEPCFIITGIRDPIERNISYFFEIMCMDKPSKVIHKNNINGDYGYIGRPQDILKMDIDSIIKLYFEKNCHTTPKDWMVHFYEIIGFKPEFNKITTFGDNQIILYTFENIEYVKDLLNIELLHINNSKKKWYATILNEFKQKIQFSEEYISSVSL